MSITCWPVVMERDLVVTCNLVTMDTVLFYISNITKITFSCIMYMGAVIGYIRCRCRKKSAKYREKGNRNEAIDFPSSFRTFKNPVTS